TATWFYRGMFEEGGTGMAPGEMIEVPVGIANYPKEFLTFPPRSMVERFAMSSAGPTSITAAISPRSKPARNSPTRSAPSSIR
ncbi:MAG TPA: hypothetical protein VF449_03750, partial [Parvibaculum sp.]